MKNILQINRRTIAPSLFILFAVITLAIGFSSQTSLPLVAEELPKIVTGG